MHVFMRAGARTRREEWQGRSGLSAHPGDNVDVGALFHEELGRNRMGRCGIQRSHPLRAIRDRLIGTASAHARGRRATWNRRLGGRQDGIVAEACVK